MEEVSESRFGVFIHHGRFRADVLASWYHLLRGQGLQVRFLSYVILVGLGHLLGQLLSLLDLPLLMLLLPVEHCLSVLVSQQLNVFRLHLLNLAVGKHPRVLTQINKKCELASKYV
jgi:hypothetical protein